MLYQRGIDHTIHCNHHPSASFDGWELPFEKLLQKIFNKQLKGLINNETTIWKAEALTKALNEGYGKSLADVDYDTPDFEMIRNLRANVWSFSSATDYQMTKDLSAALVDDNGKQRSFSDFKAEADKIGKTYNITRLQVEYNHAVASSQMASNWVGYQQNKDVAPNLKYQTVGDDRVRQAHRALNGIVKPIDDAFWDTHYPPNDWGCRCDVQAVDDEPTKITKALPQPPKMFATNLAKSGVLYPDGHPYFATETNQDKQELLNKANRLYYRDLEKETKKRFAGKDIYCKALKSNVKITKKGLSEVFNQPIKGEDNYKLKNALAVNIDQLLKKATKHSYSINTKENPMVKGYHYLTIEANGVEFYINIRELTNGDFTLWTINNRIK